MRCPPRRSPLVHLYGLEKGTAAALVEHHDWGGTWLPLLRVPSATLYRESKELLGWMREHADRGLVVILVGFGRSRGAGRCRMGRGARVETAWFVEKTGRIDTQRGVPGEVLKAHLVLLLLLLLTCPFPPSGCRPASTCISCARLGSRGVADETFAAIRREGSEVESWDTPA